MGVDPTSSMAATKLRPPAGPSRLVRRTRLTSVLDAADRAATPLVLVCAPAGSGKSTLVSSWVADLAASSGPGADPDAAPIDVAWLQLEDADADPARFWASVVASISRVVPDLPGELAALVIGSQGVADVVVPAVVNALSALDRRLVLVLDDYHLIDDPEVHRGVERLIELCPSQATLVVVSRADPPFRLGRMRVRGRISELRSADLRFDTDEAANLLGPVAEALDGRRLGELCERTEGWAAGLVLAGLSLARTDSPARFVEAFRGDDQLVAGYLTDELLDVLSPDERTRMVEAALLHRLTGPLLDAVTGRTDGGAWLAELADRNQLVIRLDSTGEWFRYHHLFRDLLMLEARRSLPAGRITELHRQAAGWFEASGYPAAAVDHLLHAGDRERAMELMRIVGPDLLGRGQRKTLRNILDRIAAGGELDTICSLLSGWDHYLAARYEQADALVAQAYERMPADLDPLRAMPLRINVAMGRGDVGTALACAREVTALGDLAVRPSELATAVGAAYVWAGVDGEARRSLDIAIARTLEEQRVTAHTLALVALAILELQTGDRAASAAAADRALASAHAHGLDGYHGIAPAFAVRAAVTDDPGRALADAEHALAIGRGATTNLGFALILAVAGDVLSAQGDERGPAVLAEANALIGSCVDPGAARGLVDRITARHGRTTASAVRSDRLVEQLSEKELAVLRYYPSTLSLREIASELYVSLNTVKTHSAAIHRKLAVSSRADAVTAARRLGLI